MIKTLVGVGDKIVRFTLPFLIIGVILNIAFPQFFSIGDLYTPTVKWISSVFIAVGIINWVWSAILVIKYVPKKKLITGGPYAIVKHPLYIGYAFLLLPWIGFLFNSWLGVLLGIILYMATRYYAPQEEKVLSESFGAEWDKYCHNVRLHRL